MFTIHCLARCVDLVLMDGNSWLGKNIVIRILCVKYIQKDKVQFLLIIYRFDERISGTRTKRAEWGTEIAVISFRIHWGNGKGLHLCRHAVARRCSDGQVGTFLVLLNGADEIFSPSPVI